MNHHIIKNSKGLYYQHAVIEREMVESIATAIKNSDFIGGTCVSQFESEFADYCDVRYAAGTSSGTAALELSMRAMAIRGGDEVIVPANTFFATVAAIVNCGATPVFCDIDPKNLLLDLSDAQRRVTLKTRALVVVHLYGRVADLVAVREFCQSNSIFLIEDACQAHGAQWEGKSVGSYGHVGCFSFYPCKNLGAIGDAGIVISNDAAIVDGVKTLRDHGRAKSNKNLHLSVGGTDRMDALQARVLALKLPFLCGWNSRRNEILELYRAKLDHAKVYLYEDSPSSISATHHVVVQVPDRDRVLAELTRLGVAAGVHYPIPCHLQPALTQTTQPVSLPQVESACERILSLPCTPDLSDAAVDEIAQVVNTIVRGSDGTAG